MKVYDRVKLVKDSPRCARYGVRKGMEGWIYTASQFDNIQFVYFDDENLPIFPSFALYEEDLTVVKFVKKRDIGMPVVLMSDQYDIYGLCQGMKGIIWGKSEQANEWIVRFKEQENLNDEVCLNVHPEDIIIDTDNSKLMKRYLNHFEKTHGIKEYDRVRLAVDKPEYLSDGVHKGMEGWVCFDCSFCNQTLVCFDEDEFSSYPTLAVAKEDLTVVESATLKDIGVNVILLTDKYKSDGFYNGMKGVICDRGEQDEEWMVEFSGQSVRLTVEEDDIIIDYE